MKTKRSLSGIYFRHQNKDGKWDNVCFEDLPEWRQEEYMNDRSVEVLKSLAKQLANTLNEIGEEFNIKKSDNENN